MEIRTDLERVLWHEIGHLCIDLIEIEDSPDFFVDDLWANYHAIAISEHKWEGGVRMLPSIQYEVLLQDDDKTSFALLGLISGCVFQTLYIKEFLKDADVGFENCFCMQQKCGGRGDIISFLGITSLIRKKYGLNKDFIEFSERELQHIYYDIITKNQEFLGELHILISRYTAIVYAVYQESENKDEFKYSLKGNYLDSLNDELIKLIKGTGFYDAVKGLKESIKEKMTEVQKSSTSS
ncbi:hypothetical protein GON26_00970 [Flavobacterium sp. GA093]|uniref:Peptidase M41 domain-containing protein n=1 Tax=Flavobacterium hydrocarbonoxydans TaxID=2683249 RepID=A0A6I4NK20_9FLAO|nr:hypothetical protein [Flavobacterium hydrocarbonoxydans]MWB92925.1 hypothetical protein [Flavobacterium hydrocarbonoxydans]